MSDKRITPDINIPIGEELDVQNAFVYLTLKSHDWKEDEIAEYLHMGRTWLYENRKRWKTNGSLETAAKLLIEPMLEATEATNRMALSERHNLVKRVIEIAKGEHGASARTSLEAWLALEEYIYKPMQDLKENPGASELSYAKKAAALKPTNIERPQFLTLKKKASNSE